MCAIVVGAITSKAAGKTLIQATEGGSLAGSFTINGINAEEVSEVENGDRLDAEISWAFKDDMDIGLNEDITYALPEIIDFHASSGPIYDDLNGVVGNYEITDDQITIRYTDQNFLDGMNRKGRLSFSGYFSGDDIPEDQITPITVDFLGLTSFHLDVKPKEQAANLSIEKLFDSVDEEDHIYECTIAIGATQANTNVVFYDEMYPGMCLYGSSPKIYTDAACTQLYEGAYTGFQEAAGVRELNATISSMADGEILYVKYQVEVEEQLYDWKTVDSYFSQVIDYDKYYSYGYEGRVPNYAEVKSDEVTKAQGDWADIYTLRYAFAKWNNEIDNVVKEGKLSWQYYINSIDDSVQKGHIVDTLPTNTEILTDEVQIFTQSGTTLEPTSNYLSFTEQTSQEGSPQVVITFSSALIAEMKSNNIYIQYFTKVKDQDQDSVRYENYGELFFDGVSQGKTGDSMEYEKPDEVTKTSEYSGATAPYVHYKIEINPAGLDLNPDGDGITIVDTMGSALDLVSSTVRVNGNVPEAGALTEAQDRKGFTLNLMDETAYEITYDVLVNLEAGDTLDETNASNVCDIQGYAVKGGGTPNVLRSVVYTSAASSSSENTPTPTPTATPTATTVPSYGPVSTEAPTATEAPTPTATVVPSYGPVPTETPTETPTVAPTPTEEPVVTATAVSTQEPTSTPKPTPAATVKPVPTATATPKATTVPTKAATAVPTEMATTKPTENPTAVPTEKSTPTPIDTEKPAATPTATATVTAVPTAKATVTPNVTEEPTATPSQQTDGENRGNNNSDNDNENGVITPSNTPDSGQGGDGDQSGSSKKKSKLSSSESRSTKKQNQKSSSNRKSGSNKSTSASSSVSYGSNPKTGDPIPPRLLWMLVLLSLGGFVLLMRKKVLCEKIST